MATERFYSERRETVRARGRVATDSSFRETRPTPAGGASAAGRVSLEPEAPIRKASIVASDLYWDLDSLSPALARGMHLLAQALRCTSEGVQALAQEDPITADLQVQSLRPLLRKLFMCRQIGDGFAAVVDALISSFDNNHGLPLTHQRFMGVQQVLVKLRDEPFLAFSAATGVIEELERVGFSTEPPGFEQLADWLTV